MIEISPRANRMPAVWWQNIVRVEVNTWFQPEHPRGAWLRTLSIARPEAAAALRQKLSEMPLPDQTYGLSPPRWMALLACGVAVGVTAAGFSLSSLPATYQAAGILLVSLLLIAIAAAAWHSLRTRRRLRAAAAICGWLERQGALLAAILDDGESNPIN